MASTLPLPVLTLTRDLVLEPAAALERVAAARPPLWPLARDHVLPLALIMPVAQGIALALGDAQARFGDGGIALQFLVLSAVHSVALSLAAVGVFAALANLLSPWFGGHRDFAQALRLGACAATPVWLSTAVLVVPMRDFPLLTAVVFAGLVHGAYLACVGLQVMLGVRADEAGPCTAFLLAGATAGSVVLGYAVSAAGLLPFI